MVIRLFFCVCKEDRMSEKFPSTQDESLESFVHTFIFCGLENFSYCHKILFLSIWFTSIFAPILSACKFVRKNKELKLNVENCMQEIYAMMNIKGTRNYGALKNNFFLIKYFTTFS
jgi:hypothetical protein